MESFAASVMRTPEKADSTDIMLADATTETKRLINQARREESCRGDLQGRSCRAAPEWGFFAAPEWGFFIRCPGAQEPIDRRGAPGDQLLDGDEAQAAGACCVVRPRGKLLRWWAPMGMGQILGCVWPKSQENFEACWQEGSAPRWAATQLLASP